MLKVKAVNMPERRSAVDFVDFQVMTIIKSHKGSNAKQALQHLNKEIKCRQWDLNILMGSIDRLKTRGRIEVRGGKLYPAL